MDVKFLACSAIQNYIPKLQQFIAENADDPNFMAMLEARLDEDLDKCEAVTGVTK